ncbi:hypothetical protein SORBI_3006G152100 [Sorghum bicolor]|uniref:Uncharacterized protein n=1 Tax=Sorghum bicolor TaxID=4558 RepID=A0A1B6PM54_SORBI|nr:hypothetical protein SORBI_3006G152100 [Sorghum bicolor]
MNRPDSIIRLLSPYSDLTIGIACIVLHYSSHPSHQRGNAQPCDPQPRFEPQVIFFSVYYSHEHHHHGTSIHLADSSSPPTCQHLSNSRN